MELHNIERVSIDNVADFSWCVKVQCTHCGYEHPKPLFICVNQKEEARTGRGLYLI
jgi:hypothetical protein